MDKDEIIKQLLITIDELKRENELFRSRIIELESRLALYENAHTPPSLRRGGNRKKIRLKVTRESLVRRKGIKA